MGPHQYPVPVGPTQEPAGPARHFRSRRCLLKGCTQEFRPTQPQSRYCSDACRRQARRWRCRQAARTWRASAQGKARRREQCRRSRRRIPLIVLPEALFAEPTPPPIQPERTGDAVTPRAEPSAPREGQRPATISQDFSARPCQRPGCYVVFAFASAWSPQRFCSCGCRRALRNVLDREERYRRRRREGYRPPRRRARPTSARPP